MPFVVLQVLQAPHLAPVDSGAEWMGMPPLPALQPASCLILSLHPGKFLVEERVLHLKKIINSKNEVIQNKKLKTDLKTDNPSPLIFFRGANFVFPDVK